LVTVLIQLDVIGGDDGGTPNGAVSTTVAGQAPAARPRSPAGWPPNRPR
jgi:hypothetical protein